MKKFAAVFPGQGSQSVGMFADFMDNEIVAKISNHCLRSSFASYNINNGIPVAVVAKAMGHKSGISVVLNNYYHENKEDVKNMMLSMIG